MYQRDIANELSGLPTLDPTVAAYKKFIEQNKSQPQDLYKFLASDQGRSLDPKLAGAMVALDKLQKAAANPPAQMPQGTVVDQVIPAGLAAVRQQQLARRPMTPQQAGLGAVAPQRGPIPQMRGGGMIAFADGGLTDLAVIKRFVPDFELLPPKQQDSIRTQLAPQIEAAMSGELPAATPIPAKSPNLQQMYATAQQEAQRPALGFAAQLRAEAEARGEGKAAEAQKTKLQGRADGLDAKTAALKNLGLIQIGASIMEAAGRPGSTALGSIGAGVARGIPMMAELQQRQDALKEKYEDRMADLDQAKELRLAGYDREARGLEKEAKSEVRALGMAIANNDEAMRRLNAEIAGRERVAGITADAAANRAAATASARERQLDRTARDQTLEALSKTGSNDPDAFEYQKYQREAGRAIRNKDKAAEAAAKAKMDEIFNAAYKTRRQHLDIQVPIEFGALTE